MDFTFTPEEAKFRLGLRAWLKENLPEGWGTPEFKMPRGEARLQFFKDWQRRLYEGGYLGLAWPRE